jgi:outer membrane protein assembly factor BamB
MPYRDAPGSAPLLLLLGGLIIAVDPERGTRRWERRLDDRPTRLFLVGQTLLVTQGNDAGARVSCFDVNSGEPRGSFLLGFEVTAGLTRGEHVILAGSRDAVCITAAGALAWSVATEVQVKNAWNGDKRALVCRDASGAELWRTEPNEGHAGEAGLLLGDLVAQPDIRG